MKLTRLFTAGLACAGIAITGGACATKSSLENYRGTTDSVLDQHASSNRGLAQYYKLVNEIESLKQENRYLRSLQLPIVTEQQTELVLVAPNLRAGEPVQNTSTGSPTTNRETIAAPAEKDSASEAIAAVALAASPASLSTDETLAVANSVLARAISRSAKSGDDDKQSARNGSPYKYSVVYVYDQQPPWDGMWNRLEQEGEKDKWRGINKLKSTYFIYVGAYNTRDMASNRQSNLNSITGESPDIRQREASSMQVALADTSKR